MTLHGSNGRTLWSQYRETRSSEHHDALVEHYTPLVQMQTTLWARGLQAALRENAAGPYDGLPRPARGTFFLPFVPPEPCPQACGSDT